MKLALVAPAGTVTLEGTVTTAGWLLVRVTDAPPAGAAPVRLTTACDEPPPVTVAGVRVRLETVTAPGEAGSTHNTGWSPLEKKGPRLPRAAGPVGMRPIVNASS